MNIWVVEDEILTSTYMKRGLQILGHQNVEVITTGEEAIEKSEKMSPDLIFMDILLAGQLNGIETSLQIRKKCNCPIIFTSAYDYKTKIESELDLSNCIFLPKPISIGDLRIALMHYQ